MSLTLQNWFENQTVRTALISALATASVIGLYQQYNKRKEIKRIKQEMAFDWSEEKQDRFSGPEHEALVQEQLSRNILFLGEEVSKELSL